jgi:hypothetical protein
MRGLQKMSSAMFRPTSGFRIRSSSELKRLKNPFGRKPAVRQARSIPGVPQLATSHCDLHNPSRAVTSRSQTDPTAGAAGDNTDLVLQETLDRKRKEDS